MYLERPLQFYTLQILSKWYIDLCIIGSLKEQAYNNSIEMQCSMETYLYNIQQELYNPANILMFIFGQNNLVCVTRVFLP